MSKIDSVGSFFLSIEKPSWPMHIAALQIFKMPLDHKETFLKDLIDDFSHVTEWAKPFNQKVSIPVLQIKRPKWVDDPDFNPRYHIRHFALPKPGTMDQLLEAVSQLHETMLDRSRPLWMFYLIEGLDNNRFALYYKIHHACIDGVGGIKMMKECLSQSPFENKFTPPWQKKRKISKKNPPVTPFIFLKKTCLTIGHQTKAIPEVSQVIAKYAMEMFDKNKHLVLPYSAPKSGLNTSINASRRIEVNQFPLDKIKSIAKTNGVTINDVVLGISGAALRNYLKNQNQLPNKSLVANMPLSIRHKNDGNLGNKVSSILCQLGTDIEDHKERLKLIHSVTDRGKAEVNQMSSQGIKNLNFIFFIPFFVMETINKKEYFSPPFNLYISNVPGPQHRRYLKGAEMESFYPISAIGDRMALNITVISYDNSLFFGLIACPKRIPNLDNLSLLMKQAYEDLLAV